LIVTFLMLFSAAGVAASFSFIGNFVNDNDVQLFSFTLLNPGTVTVQTWGYGGGTNAAGMPIAPGGFESTLSIFNAPSGTAAGGPFDPGGTPCAPRNIDPNLLPLTLCLDAYGQAALPAGNYFLSLTQSPNEPVSGDLGDGFFFTDAVPDPNFNNHFVGTLGLQRDSHWAVDILSVDAASQIGGTTPEPASAALVAGAMVLAGFWRRRLNRS